MSAAKLKKQLQEARRQWQRDDRNTDLAGDPGFMRGVIRGISEALRIVQTLQREDLCRTAAARRPFSRSSAVLFYQACTTAYGRLKYSDRTGAMKVLKKVLDQKPVREEREG